MEFFLGTSKVYVYALSVSLRPDSHAERVYVLIKLVDLQSANPLSLPCVAVFLGMFLPPVDQNR